MRWHFGSAQRWVFAVLAGACVAAGWHVLLGASGDAVRRVCLAAAFLIYYVRVLFTVFVFQRHGIGWGSVFGISGWVLCIYLLLAFLGGGNRAVFAYAGAIGIALFLLGSWMNSWAEYTRHVWKLRPANRGRLYSEGLFRYSRHPNYVGDLVSFSGLCLIAGSWITWIVPLLMLAGFVFVNIPLLDARLREHYGAEFDAWASRTPRLIPLIY